MNRELGRLLCVGIRGAEPGEAQLEADLESCREAGVGGVILFDVDVPRYEQLRREGMTEDDARRAAQRNVVDPEQLRRLVAHVRAVLGAEVFVAVDQEGGRVARLHPGRGFHAGPSAVRFAAMSEAARREAATRQAEQLADLGIDLNFAPCVDLALESANPIIAGLDRAYSNDPDVVVDCARVVLEAHRAAGVAACLKHFPGHGSSRADTHLGAVDISASWQRQPELAPYRALLPSPATAVMVAHVVHRQLDPERPASLSPAIVGGLLREELGFDGVVITDSIDMRAVADRYDPAEATVLAVEAGVDFVIDGFNLRARAEHPARAMVEALERATVEGRLGAARIERSLERLQQLRSQIGRAR